MSEEDPDAFAGETVDLLNVEVEPEAIPAEVAPDDPVARRRADIDTKQEMLARVMEEIRAEGVVLFNPANVAWFTGGMNVRGLITETERPGVYTNGRQRWLVCSNVDSQRFFDEELDQLGFQLKEWQWSAGRAPLIGEIVSGKKIATDRPFPNLPLIVDRLRSVIRPLLSSDHEKYVALGQLVSHAVEATARTLTNGETEQEVAGQVAHRLLHHGADLLGVSVAADDRARKFRRSGFSATPIHDLCTIQATGTRDGLHATVSRTVCFGKSIDTFKKEFDAACRLAAVYRSLSTPGHTLTEAFDAGRRITHGTPYEYEWRHSQPGYGTGWVAAEELRRMGADEPFIPDQPLTWQARVGSAAVVDTVVVTPTGPLAVTPPDGWPFKHIKIEDQTHDIPDVLVRSF